jgi:hypothetical protein
MGKNVTTARVYDMLETNQQNVRTNFFNNLSNEWQKSGVFAQFSSAQYTLKSATKDRVVLTVSNANEQKDLQVIQEMGKWKKNFFDDLDR